WSACTATERASVIDAVGHVVGDRRGEAVSVMADEAGKTAAEADPEVSEAIDFAHYYAREAVRLADVHGASSRPLGVVAVVPPWNFPFAIPMGGVLAALAAGNAVILKPAPQSPGTARLVAECCWEAGVPRSVLHVVNAPDDEAGRWLITHPDVDAVVLT